MASNDWLACSDVEAFAASLRSVGYNASVQLVQRRLNTSYAAPTPQLRHHPKQNCYASVISSILM